MATATPTPTARLLAPIDALLDDLDGLLAQITPDDYARDAVGTLRGSIGGHFRHVLDHVATLARHAPGACCCYDDRARGTAVETDPAAARDALAKLRIVVAALAHRSADEPIELQVSLTRTGDLATLRSSLGREIAFVQSHTIHHNAIIAAIARALGYALSADFGYAPATLAHLDQQECAPSPSSR